MRTKRFVFRNNAQYEIVSNKKNPKAWLWFLFYFDFALHSLFVIQFRFIIGFYLTLSALSTHFLPLIPFLQSPFLYIIVLYLKHWSQLLVSHLLDFSFADQSLLVREFTNWSLNLKVWTLFKSFFFNFYRFSLIFSVFFFNRFNTLLCSVTCYVT